MGILLDSVSGQGFLAKRKRSEIAKRDGTSYLRYWAHFRTIPALETKPWNNHLRYTFCMRTCTSRRSSWKQPLYSSRGKKGNHLQLQLASLFGLASLLIKLTNSIGVSSPIPVVMFRDREEPLFSWRRNNHIPTTTTVVDDSVVREQSVKDLEAEIAREKVTRPGFSFFASGLLFPYHLGVVQFL